MRSNLRITFIIKYIRLFSSNVTNIFEEKSSLTHFFTYCYDISLYIFPNTVKNMRKIIYKHGLIKIKIVMENYMIINTNNCILTWIRTECQNAQ